MQEELEKVLNKEDDVKSDIKIEEINDNDTEEFPVGSSKEKSHKEKKIKKKDSKEIEKLKEEFERLNKEKVELVEKVKYTQAELINYRQRKDEETANLLEYCNKDIITDIIPIVDNFERAISLDDNNLDDELSKFLSGFKMMYSSLTEVLKKYGVTVINRRGEIFDSNLEEPLMTDCVKDKKDGEILEVLLKGYKLKDRVIRPATVKVNKIEDKKEEEK